MSEETGQIERAVVVEEASDNALLAAGAAAVVAAGILLFYLWGGANVYGLGLEARCKVGSTEVTGRVVSVSLGGDEVKVGDYWVDVNRCEFSVENGS